MRKVAVAGLLVPLLLGSAAPREARGEEPPVGSVPLPLDRTGTVRAEGKTYFIDGAQVVPRTAEVTIQLGVTIIGINGASLEVQGGFKVHGTQDTWVQIRNVDFSPTTSPLKGLHLDMADLQNCKFKHGETGGFHGHWTIENSCLQRDCAFDVQLQGGFLKIMTVEFGIPCRIRCVRQKENPVPIEVEIRSSWMKEVSLSGTAVANFVHSEIRGGLDLANVTEVLVDGCDVSQHLTFRQAPEDSFKKVAITKVNFFDGGRLVLDRARGEDTKNERVKLDKPFFGAKETGIGILDPKEIAGLISDSEDDEKASVKAWVVNPNKRKHLLVSYDLRSRAPPLR